MSHTPGPWKLEKDREGESWIMGDDFQAVCMISANELSTREIDDARLIAAAPDLLKAVKQLMKSMETGMADFNSFDEANWKFALSVIAKIESK